MFSSQVLHRITGLDRPAIPELQGLARVKRFVLFGRVIVKLFEMKERLQRIRVICQQHKEPFVPLKSKQQHLEDKEALEGFKDG